jgi:ABC-2 type transport system ATP-binding protein
MAEADPTAPFAVYVRDLWVRYAGAWGRPDVEAVSRFEFEILPGEVVALVGPRGAGKSSTLKVLTGLVRPDRGEVKIFGHRAGSAEANAHIGYLPEGGRYYPHLTAAEFLYHFGRLAGMRRKEIKGELPRLLHFVGLEGCGEGLLKDFSRGMLQRLGIAQAMLGTPEILVLDEVAADLDPPGRRQLRNLLQYLQGQGTTILFASHQLSELELLCSRVLIVHHGRIIKEGSLSDLTRQVRRTRIAYRFPGAKKVNGEQNMGKVEEVMTPMENLGRKIQNLTEQGAEILYVRPERFGLEDYYVEILMEEEAL